MDARLNKIIDKHSQHFSDWRKALSNHNLKFRDSKISEEERERVTYTTAGIFIKISEIYFEYGAFKDTFDNSKMGLSMYGPELIIKSNKTGAEFNLGIDYQGLYLESQIEHPENLRHMGDDFYKDMLSLSDLGIFEFQENERYGDDITSKYSKAYANKKSSIFRLVRNYVVGIRESNGEEDHRILLGDFHIHWPYEQFFDDVIYNSCLAFKVLYGLNYSLWKIYDLETKKKAK